MTMLEGRTVRLTRLNEDDVQQVLLWRNSIELKRLTGPGPFLPLTVSDVDIQSTPTTVQFAIRSMETGGLIGYIALSNIAWSTRTADLGIYIGQIANRGKGWGTEAISLLLDYAFDELNLHRVQLDVVDYNSAAIRAYDQLGFFNEGVRRQHGERDGKRYDVLLFGVLAGEWRDRRASETREA